MPRLELKAIVLICLVVWLTDAGPAFCGQHLKVFVSVLPQKYFVEKIGGDKVEVSVMVAPGASPATYEPRPRQMVALNGARLYFAVGVPFEAVWLEKIAAAGQAMEIAHTEAGVVKIPMEAHDDHEAHGDAGRGEGAFGILDPHIWLSPPLVRIQAGNILNALVAADPLNETFYRKQFQAFALEIDRLDEDLKGLFADKRGLAFMVFHPSWGYFARAYGLRQVPIEVEGKDPKPGQLLALISQARQDGVRVIFAQPQFSRQSAQVIARAIGAEVAPADPLAEDWANNLRAVAEAFARALR